MEVCADDGLNKIFNEGNRDIAKPFCQLSFALHEYPITHLVIVLLSVMDVYHCRGFRRNRPSRVE